MTAPKLTIKQILLSQQNWWRFYQKYQPKIRTAIVVAIVKLLSCRNQIRGYQQYHCANPQCTHTKRIVHTCKSKACSSCGKKATERWVTQQYQILPRTSWQHITFTMPCQLWDFFWYNRHLLHPLGKLAADCVKTIARKKHVTPGIFIALHTFGRDLKRNVHVHLSTTTGGISKDGRQWKKLFFHQATLMRMWRYRLLKLFRDALKKKRLIIPQALKKQLHPDFTLTQFFDHLYQKRWVVHCSKPSKDHQQNVNYLSRYIKRPAIAESKLRHYDGTEVAFKYLDHHTKAYRRFTLTVEQFIARFIQHIPDIGFRMIRYYGFLAHRVRSQLLPLVYQRLGQECQDTALPTFAQLLQKHFNVDPFVCILCGQPLLLSTIRYGKYNVPELLGMHRALATLKIA